MKPPYRIIATLALGVMLASCGGNAEPAANASAEPIFTPKAKVSDDPMENKGVGPVTSLELGTLDEELAASGATIFEEKCTACHKTETRYIGPPLSGITERRSPEWIMNMILNPEQMVKEDPIAKDLLKEYLSPMANQSLTEDEARKILEYFRTI